jgi:hypothetical protein
MQLAVLQQEDALIRKLLFQIPVGETSATARVGKVQRTIIPEHEVVGTIEALAFVAIRQNGALAVFLEPNDGAVCFGGVDNTSLRIDGDPLAPKRTFGGRVSAARVQSGRSRKRCHRTAGVHLLITLAGMSLMSRCPARRSRTQTMPLMDAKPSLERFHHHARRDDGIELGGHPDHGASGRRLRPARVNASCAGRAHHQNAAS